MPAHLKQVKEEYLKMIKMAQLLYIIRSPLLHKNETLYETKIYIQAGRKRRRQGNTCYYFQYIL